MGGWRKSSRAGDTPQARGTPEAGAVATWGRQAIGKRSLTHPGAVNGPAVKRPRTGTRSGAPSMFQARQAVFEGFSFGCWRETILKNVTQALAHPLGAVIVAAVKRKCIGARGGTTSVMSFQRALRHNKNWLALVCVLHSLRSSDTLDVCIGMREPTSSHKLNA